MPRVNLDRAPTSLAALNGLLARTGYDIQIVRGNGYYYVVSDDEAICTYITGEAGLYSCGPYLNGMALRYWVEAVAEKFSLRLDSPYYGDNAAERATICKAIRALVA